MALVFPLPLADFFNGLPIEAGVVDLGEALEMSETGGGEILTAAIGNRLWKLDIAIATRDYQQGAAIMARLDLLRYPGRSLIARASPVAGPALDPKGLNLGGAAVTLAAVAANNRELTLVGLPNGYTLGPGDMLSFRYGTNPVRYALHRIAAGGAAGTDGRLTVEVTPFIAPGWTVNAPVKLVGAEFKAVVVPGSVDPGKTGSTRVDGIKFSLIQTFR